MYRKDNRKYVNKGRVVWSAEEDEKQEQSKQIMKLQQEYCWRFQAKEIQIKSKLAYTEANVAILQSNDIKQLLAVPSKLPLLYYQKDVTLSIFKSNIYPEWEDSSNKDAFIVELSLDVLEENQNQYAQICQEIFYMFISLTLMNPQSINGLYCKTRKLQNSNQYQVFFQLWCIKSYQEIQQQLEKIFQEAENKNIFHKIKDNYVSLYQIHIKEKKLQKQLKKQLQLKIF